MQIIRPAVAADRAAVETLIQAAYGPYIEHLGIRPGPLDDDHGKHIAQGQVHLLEDRGQLCALAVLVIETEALLLDNVAVSPDAQKRGHGRRLIAYAEEIARKHGLSMIRLYTHEKMEANQALYKSLGFNETHRAEDRGLRRVFMSKSLTS
ncbi:MAG: GNAT family N-acetyltransferase [Allorhizobium sp.]